MTIATHYVIICLASNSEPEEHLRAARAQLATLLDDLQFTSEHWTEPESIHQKTGMYLNQLCQGYTKFDMETLNRELKKTESFLGRTHDESGKVAIDLDILQYDGERHHLHDWERNYVKELIRELRETNHHNLGNGSHG